MSTPRELSALPVHPHPTVDTRSYRLRIDGLVANSLALGVADLLALPQQRLQDDFTCLEGWTVPDLDWAGVRLGDVLDLVHPTPAAQWVQASFADFSLPLPLAEARAALLALTLDGALLAPEHGAPVRLLVPGGECYTSVKWLDHLELRAEPAENSAQEIALNRLRR
ncbi:MAG: molybdopterin-dependent oxidoreductase [Dehalococcoidia bacterium]|nr:molybdopterin-dependent oxidoreductase [Dehalococcoidia bacterium]